MAEQRHVRSLKPCREWRHTSTTQTTSGLRFGQLQPYKDRAQHIVATKSSVLQLLQGGLHQLAQFRNWLIQRAPLA